VPDETPNITGVIAALTSAFVPATAGAELATQTSNVFTTESSSVLTGATTNTTIANAYLNYVVFNQSYDAIASGHQKIGGWINSSQPLNINNIVIGQKGSIYIWVSNESNYNLNVYFDDLKVTHLKGPILQEDHYYPFGANISALSSTAPLSKPNQFKFNGIEENTDFDLNTYDAFFRNYDPVLGRWWQIDPKASERESPYVGMGNNPILYNDYLGDTIKFASDEASQALQQQYDALRRESKSFNTLITLLEQSKSVINIKVDEVAVDKVAEKKGLGESKDRVGGFAERSDLSITMRAGQTDKQLAEEPFHVFQFLTYGTDRNTAEIESEAKLFDYDVVNEAADSRGDASVFGPGGSEMGVTEVQFSQEDTGSRIIRAGSNREAYNTYLKSFSQYQNATGGPYNGTIRTLKPIAYNNINTVQKIDPTKRPRSN
jgi:RHS repeat-associated protein